MPGKSDEAVRLRELRETAGLTQEQAAPLLGISVRSLSRKEGGAQPITARDLAAAETSYRRKGRISEETVSGYRPDMVSRETDDEPWSPNPALRGVLPDRAYEVAMGYCRRLVAAGLPPEAVEDAERLFIDPRYAKANSRKGRELDENDWIMLIDARWESMREALSWTGIRV